MADISPNNGEKKPKSNKIILHITQLNITKYHASKDL